ncbi:alginate lyase family protein [Thioalkalivibrio sp. ARh3]|uniref:alginate lyase family protein n=1 Tax=Thioalkalivibrio sp. ARh3 TaxID=1158148 RepID=UPI00039BD980
MNLRRVLAGTAKTVRSSPAWPLVRPVYASVNAFVDVRALVLGLYGGDGVATSALPRARDRGEAPPCRAEVAQFGAARQSEVEFALYRVIGNDLWPRHRVGQSRENVAWILEHEPELPGCEKRWVVNRIVDPLEEEAILRLLEEAGQEYVHIPFRWEEYRTVGWDVCGVPARFAPGSRGFNQLSDLMQGRVLMRLYRHKNNYVMNNNGARNAALEDGRQRAAWVLPWDGNCFVTGEAWNEIVEGIHARPDRPYHIVPMARITRNEDLLDGDFRPEANEEPQIIFRQDSRESFDESFYYGHRPKVELLWRLGVTGPWDAWPQEPWDMAIPDFAPEAGCYAETGWVARLFSGQAVHEVSKDNKAFHSRGRARIEAVKSMLDRVDQLAFDGAREQRALSVIVESRLEDPALSEALQDPLVDYANEALGRGPFSVMDKTTLPPSGDPHDYWHPAPYYWPHPLRIPGLPYVLRDGQRVPGTRLYEPESERYDRTRLQRLFDDGLVLAIAHQTTGDRRYGEHAAGLVRRWFLDEETAMNPHLEYAQVRRGHNRNRGSSYGLIEFKDLYYFLDGVCLLLQSGLLSEQDRTRLENWMGQYLEWLQSSPQGIAERASENNHGTYYDLQVASIAAFLGEWKLVRETLRDSRSRIIGQFEPDGRLPKELARPTSAHYECFTIQGWIHLARLAESVGEDLWSFEGPEGQSLRRGMEWLLAHMGKPWPYQQIDEFDDGRFFPILHAYQDKFGDAPVDFEAIPMPGAIKPVFFPHDGIPPFWQFTLERTV